MSNLYNTRACCRAMVSSITPTSAQSAGNDRLTVSVSGLRGCKVKIRIVRF